MKKRFTGIVAIVAVLISMTACGNYGGTSDKSVTTTTSGTSITTTGPVVTTTVATVTNEPEEVLTTTTSSSSEEISTTTEPTATSDVDSEETKTITTTEKETTTANTTTKKKPATVTTTTTKKTTTTAIVTSKYNATMYANQTANVRKGNSTQYSIIDTVKVNTKVTVTGKCSNGWYAVEVNGKKGYMASSVLSDKQVSINNNTSTLSSKEEQARKIAQKIADEAIAKYGKEQSADQLYYVTERVYDYYKQCVYSQDDSDDWTAYGVFIAKKASCAGSTRALGMVLDCLGYKWEHINENEWTHQWCRVYLNCKSIYVEDGEKTIHNVTQVEADAFDGSIMYYDKSKDVYRILNTESGQKVRDDFVEAVQQYSIEQFEKATGRKIEKHLFNFGDRLGTYQEVVDFVRSGKYEAYRISGRTLSIRLGDFKEKNIEVAKTQIDEIYEKYGYDRLLIVTCEFSSSYTSIIYYHSSASEITCD